MKVKNLLTPVVQLHKEYRLEVPAEVMQVSTEVLSVVCRWLEGLDLEALDDLDDLDDLEGLDLEGLDLEGLDLGGLGGLWGLGDLFALFDPEIH